MSLLLHIETATDICSVALAENGNLIDLKETHAERSHAGVLAVYIDELLKENKLSASNLDAIAVSKGPGSYTGLRIGVSVAKGLCYGADLPLIAVDTLESMYHGIIKKEKVYTDNTIFAPMIDARRMEVYTCMFNIQGKKIDETMALVVEKDTFNEKFKENIIIFFGSGADKFSELFTNDNARFILNFKLSSVDMIELAYKHFTERKFEDLAYFEPYYLKNFIATVPKRKGL